MKILSKFNSIIVMFLIALIAFFGVSASANVKTNKTIGVKPYAKVKIDKVYDGTGFENKESSTFVNKENGFNPGDNGPDDGIVSSYDYVGYDVEVNVEPGDARNISVIYKLPEFLSFDSKLNSDVCQNTKFIKGKLNTQKLEKDNEFSCDYEVEEGSNITFVNRLILTAKDTASLVKSNQVVEVSVGITGKDSYQSYKAKPVSVVSAPSTDLVIKPSDDTTYCPVDKQSYCENVLNTRDGEADKKQAFDILVDSLSYNGYDKAKGVSKTSKWGGILDVSAFKDLKQITWWVDGKQVNLENNQIILKDKVGNAKVEYQVKDDNWGLGKSEVKTFDVNLIVDKDAFSSVDFKNNGDGWTPGLGEDKDYKTQNEKNTGASKGYLAQNNKWTSITINNMPKYGEGVVYSPYKELRRTYDNSKTIWEKENKTYLEDDNILVPRSIYSNQDEVKRSVSSNTELETIMGLNASYQANDKTKKEVAIGDTWDTNQYNVRGKVNVLNMPKTTNYYIEWSKDKKSEKDLTNINDKTGWVRQETPIKDASSIRIVFSNITTIYDAKENRNVYDLKVSLPLEVKNKLSDGDYINDSASFAAPDYQSEFYSVNDLVIYRLPKDPTLDLEIKSSDKIISNNNDRQSSWTFKPVINKETDRDSEVISFEIELDPCIIEANLNNTPNYQIDSIQLGSGCGSENPKPGKIIISMPKGWDMKNWKDGQSILPEFILNTKTSMLAVNTVYINSTMSSDNKKISSVSDAITSQLTPNLEYLSSIKALTPKVEVGDTLKYQAYVNAVKSSDSEYYKTIVALPNRGDDNQYAKDITENYDGVKQSNIEGSYTVDINLAENNSTPGTKILCSTELTRDVNDESFSAANCNSNDIKLINIQIPANKDIVTANVNINLKPTDNEIDNNYLMWMLPTTIAGKQNEMPYPANEEVVSSDITGHVYFNTDGQANPYIDGDKGFSNVTLGLYDKDGKQLTTTNTDNNGYYEFSRYHSGDYQVKVIDGVPSKYKTEHNGDQDLIQVYSYYNNKFEHAKSYADIDLGLDSKLDNVDFGYFAKDPHFKLDKSVSKVNCDENDLNKPCDVSWNVTIENNGNTTLTNGKFTDTTSKQVYDIEVEIGQKIKKVIPRIDTNDLDYSRNQSGAYLLTTSGEVYSIGSGEYGANGNGYATNNLIAQKVQGLPLNIKEVIARGYTGGYALTKNGEVYSWGDGSFGANGNGSYSHNLIAQKVQGFKNNDIVEKVILHGGNSNHTVGAYALTKNGEVYSWGDGASGENGNGSASHNLIAKKVIGFDDSEYIVKVITRSNSDNQFGAYALTKSGTVYSWGYNEFSNSEYYDPNLTAQKIQGLPTNIKDVIDRAGSGGYALTTSGEVYSWGEGKYGANGNGSIANNYTAQKVQGLDNVAIKEVVARYDSGAYALSEDGIVYSWGRGYYGANGNASVFNNRIAEKVLGLPEDIKMVQILTRYGTGGYALSEDGIAYSWGRGIYHANGNDSSEDSTIANEVVGLKENNVEVKKIISRGSDGAYALTTKGEIYSWGGGLYKTPNFSKTAVKILDLPSNIKDINPRGVSGTYALTTNGEVYSWGFNTYGENGNGSNVGSFNPTPQPVTPTWQEENFVPYQSDEQRITSESKEEFIKRTYDLYDIDPGDTMTITIKGKVNRTKDNQVIGNQAYASFTELSLDDEDINLNKLPDYGNPSDKYEAGKWSGNNTCAIKDEGNFITRMFKSSQNQDECDQVYAKIPGVSDIKLSNLSGKVFEDTKKAGKYETGMPLLEGIKVELRQGNGSLIGTTNTNENGYYEFNDLLLADDYYVVFNPGEKGIVYTKTTESCPTLDESCAKANGNTVKIKVGENPIVEVNAGIIKGIEPNLSVDKGFDSNKDKYDSTYVLNKVGEEFIVKTKVKNTGNEPINNIIFSDTTKNGSKVNWTACSLENINIEFTLDNKDGVDKLVFDKEFKLGVNESVICQGTLKTELDLHKDSMSVSGKGYLTEKEVNNGPSDFETVLGEGLSQPDAPTLKELCGDEKEVILPANNDKVRYESYRQGDYIYVEAIAQDGYFFNSNAITKWKFDIKAEDCSIKPTNPNIIDPNKPGKPDVPEITIDGGIITQDPAYKLKCDEVLDVKIPANTEEITYTKEIDGKYIIVKATPNKGYYFDKGATTEWKFELKAGPTCVITSPPSITEPTNPTNPIPPQEEIDGVIALKPDYKIDCEAKFELVMPNGPEHVTYTSKMISEQGVYPIKYEVEAKADNGFAFKEGVTTKWIVEIPKSELCDIEVTPEVPNIVDPGKPGIPDVPEVENNGVITSAPDYEFGCYELKVKVPVNSKEVTYKKEVKDNQIIVTATANNGYKFKDGVQTEWKFELPNPQNCPTDKLVELVRPELNTNVDCDKDYEVIIPEVEGLEFSKTVDGKKIKVTAKIKDGYVLKQRDTLEWEFDTTNDEECIIKVKPIAPALNKDVECEEDYKLVIPADTDQIYYEVTWNDKVATIEAKSKEGCEIEEGMQSVWILDTTNNEVCDLGNIVTPERPNIVDPNKPGVPDVPEVENNGIISAHPDYKLKCEKTLDVRVPEDTKEITYKSIIKDGYIIVSATANEGFEIKKGSQTEWKFKLIEGPACQTTTDKPNGGNNGNSTLPNTGNDNIYYMVVSTIIGLSLSSIVFFKRFYNISKSH